MDRDKGQWFVLQTLSGQENRVRDRIMTHLERENELGIYEVLIPTEKVSEVRQGKRTTMTRKFFPGYVLIRMDLFEPETGEIRKDAWFFTRQTQGVIGFLGAGDTPTPLSDREVEELLFQMDDEKEKVKPKVEFEVGETVRIKDGAFENFEGTIEEYDASRGKLTIMVSIFGRSTPVELEFWQVEKE